MARATPWTLPSPEPSTTIAGGHYPVRIPIRYQLIIPLVAIAVVCFVGSALFYARQATVETRARVRHQLRGVTSVLAETNYPLNDVVLSKMGRLANAEFLWADDQGRVFAKTEQAPLPENLASLAAAGSPELAMDNTVSVANRAYYYAAVSLSRPRSDQSSGTLHIFFSLGSLRFGLVGACRSACCRSAR